MINNNYNYNNSRLSVNNINNKNQIKTEYYFNNINLMNLNKII